MGVRRYPPPPVAPSTARLPSKQLEARERRPPRGSEPRLVLGAGFLAHDVEERADSLAAGARARPPGSGSRWGLGLCGFTAVAVCSSIGVASLIWRSLGAPSTAPTFRGDALSSPSLAERRADPNPCRCEPDQLPPVRAPRPILDRCCSSPDTRISESCHAAGRELVAVPRHAAPRRKTSPRGAVLVGPVGCVQASLPSA